MFKKVFDFVASLNIRDRISKGYASFILFVRTYLFTFIGMIPGIAIGTMTSCAIGTLTGLNFGFYSAIFMLIAVFLIILILTIIILALWKVKSVSLSM